MDIKYGKRITLPKLLIKKSIPESRQSHTLYCLQRVYSMHFKLDSRITSRLRLPLINAEYTLQADLFSQIPGEENAQGGKESAIQN